MSEERKRKRAKKKGTQINMYPNREEMVTLTDEPLFAETSSPMDIQENGYQ